MENFEWSDLLVLWPLLIPAYIAAIAYGYQVGWRHAVKADASVIKHQAAEIERCHIEINDLIDRLPFHERPIRPGVFINRSETEH